MKYRVIFLWMLLFSVGCQNSDSHQHHQHASNSSNEEADYDCKNCGMPSQDQPKWNVKALSQKKYTWFCSPKCMFAAIHHPTKPIQLDSVWVLDYYELKRILAQDAFYVIKSKIKGPMGEDFIPLKDKASAEDFLKEHEGQKILTFEAINQNVLKEIEP